MVMREGIQDVQRITKDYNTVDGDFLRRHQVYGENTQKRAEKPGCIFIFVGSQDILSAPVCVRWCTGRCVDAQAGLNPAMPVLFRYKKGKNFNCGNIFSNLRLRHKFGQKRMLCKGLYACLRIKSFV